MLPLLHSRTQGDIIAWIGLHPENEYSLVEIAEHVGVSPATVMREVDRLADAGLVTETRRGNTRLVKASQDIPVFRPLAELMAATFGRVPNDVDVIVVGSTDADELFDVEERASQALGRSGTKSTSAKSGQQHGATNLQRIPSAKRCCHFP